GASRSQLIQQLLAESFVISAIGAFCGVIVAQVLSRMLISFFSTKDSTLFLDLYPDWNIILFTSGLAILTCFLFGLAPAIQASRVSLIEGMKTGSRGVTSGRNKFRLRQGLVVTQISLSLMLLVGALLFVRTLRNLSDLDPGFAKENIL